MSRSEDFGPVLAAAEPKVLVPEGLPTVLTIPETAEILRIGRNSAYEAARTGEIRPVFLPGIVFL